MSVREEEGWEVYRPALAAGGVLFVECRRHGGELYEVKKEIEREDGCNEVKCKGRNAPEGTRRDFAGELCGGMHLGMKSRGVK